MSERQLPMCSIVHRNGHYQLVTDASAQERARGIADLEGFVVRVVDDFLLSRGIPLSEHDRQELIGALVGHAWREAQRFDPAKAEAISRARGQHPDMRGFLYTRLRWRATDWWRAHVGVDKSHKGTAAGPFTHQIVALNDDHSAQAVPTPDSDLTLDRAHDLLGFDPALLSPEARWTLARVAVPLATGRTLGEVAITERRSKDMLTAMLEGLRAECEKYGPASTAAG